VGLVVEANDAAAAALPVDLGHCGIPHAVAFPLCGTRAGQISDDLADHAGVSDDRNAPGWMFLGQPSHGSEAPEPELTVTLATGPAKLLVGLPLVGLPQLGIGIS
jgi:hypothetical protein